MHDIMHYHIRKLELYIILHDFGCALHLHNYATCTKYAIEELYVQVHEHSEYNRWEWL